MLFRGFKFGMILQVAIGPISLFILDTAMKLGLFNAMFGVFAVAIADAIFIFAAILGIGKILDKNSKAQNFFKYFGSLVLILFGISTILSVKEISLLPTLNLNSDSILNNVFLKAFFLTVANPLTIVFWAGVFSTKLSSSNLKKSDMYVFGAGCVLSTIFSLTVISVIGYFVKIYIPIFMVDILNIIVGLVLIGYGVKSAISKTNN